MPLHPPKNPTHATHIAALNARARFAGTDVTYLFPMDNTPEEETLDL
jgi:hypothetical protein